jgi:hypothetical protein
MLYRLALREVGGLDYYHVARLVERLLCTVEQAEYLGTFAKCLDLLLKTCRRILENNVTTELIKRVIPNSLCFSRDVGGYDWYHENVGS